MIIISQEIHLPTNLPSAYCELDDYLVDYLDDYLDDFLDDYYFPGETPAYQPFTCIYLT